MRDTFIIGVDTLRFGKYLDKTHQELVKMTLFPALEDAGIQLSDIQSVQFANSLWGYSHGQCGIRGHLAMRYCGMEKTPITNIEAACSGGALALHGAWKDIQTGLFDCTLAIGVEKLRMEDKQKSLAAFDVFLDIAHKKEHFENRLKVLDTLTVEIPREEGAERSPFMDLYGLNGLIHMDMYGTTQRQFAAVAAKSHHFGSLNPRAQYQFDMTIDDVMNDYLVAYPLTRAMCSPVGDGAACAIVCSDDFLKKMPANVQKRAVKIRASVYMSGRERELKERSTCVEAAVKAYDMAKLKPADIDVAEVHDASAPGEIFHYENLGFCPVGEGGKFAETGETGLGGLIPVNPSGGLISRGHPISASGLAQIYELVTQLRGEAGARQTRNARIALAENGGGSVQNEEAAFAIHIFEKND